MFSETCNEMRLAQTTKGLSGQHSEYKMNLFDLEIKCHSDIMFILDTPPCLLSCIHTKYEDTGKPVLPFLKFPPFPKTLIYV